VTQLTACEQVAPRTTRPYREFHEELKVSEARLRLVRRGCSLVKALRDPPNYYEPTEPKRRYAALSDVLQRLPASSGVPPVRQIQFVQPFTGKGIPERVDLVSKISIAEPQNVKLQRVIQGSDRNYMEHHNDMIEYLNHKNQRRLQASERFFGDVSKHGLKRAQLNAKREGQVSRLRVMGKTPWWEEFIQFAFLEPVGKEEEKLITKISRTPRLSLKEYYEYTRDLENGGPQNERCLELLRWLNAKCQWADENIVEIFKFDERRQRRSIARMSTAPVEFDE
jgi:hypothetical protein